MLKFFGLVRRKPGFDPGEFHDYWRTNHAEVVLDMPDSAPPIRKYVQNHVLDEVYAETDPAFDGLAEIWFDDRQALRDWFFHEHYQETVTADEDVFIDRAASDGFVMQDTHMDSNPIPENPTKLFVPITRRDDMSPTAFHQHWRYEHSQTITSTDAWDLVAHYEQNHAMNEVDPAEVTSYDGIAVAWFADYDDFAAWQDHPDQDAIIRPSLEDFLDLDQSLWLTTNHELMT